MPSVVLMAIFFSLGLGSSALAEEETMQSKSSDTWLPSLITDTPQEGFALAVTLSQKGVGTTQPDTSVRKALRGAYAHDPDSLIAASQVIALHFQTVAAANDYWKND
nr:hexameric tyrosine-coordinated heme protein [uncultured Halomonas sp.]